MAAKDDFVSLFQDVATQLPVLPQSPQLADFNYMITSLRTIDNLAEKLERVGTGQLTASDQSRVAQQTWVDLRSMDLVDAGQYQLNDFGKACLAYFGVETDQFKREHFILSCIRHRAYGIPNYIYQEYQRKLANLNSYLTAIPQSTQKGNELLLDQEKVFFTE